MQTWWVPRNLLCPVVSLCQRFVNDLRYYRIHWNSCGHYPEYLHLTDFVVSLGTYSVLCRLLQTWHTYQIQDSSEESQADFPQLHPGIENLSHYDLHRKNSLVLYEIIHYLSIGLVFCCFGQFENSLLNLIYISSHKLSRQTPPHQVANCQWMTRNNHSLWQNHRKKWKWNKT